jgi:2,4-dienoyl-CoA reductase-like NADH-dependent reductase (Old Yellow Enzyme family)
MAEVMSASHNPGKQLIKAYGEWADGGWGMILTGTLPMQGFSHIIIHSLLALNPNTNSYLRLGNVQVSRKYHGSPMDVASFPPTAATPELRTAWKNYAATAQRSGTPCLVQICHPGRQSPLGAGEKGFFAKNVAPSAVVLNMGPSYFSKMITSFMFGTPKEMSLDEVEEEIANFIEAGKQAFEAGFKGVEIHGAHGYLVSQFLSPRSNLRTDAFGGTPEKRAEFVLRIIKGTRAVTSPEFCIGIKLNSADVADQGTSDVDATLTQIGLIAAAGIDFIEISGGTYENPLMLQHKGKSPSEIEADSGIKVKASTLAREAFFLDFAATVRSRYPKIPLMVTGGFRTRAGMRAALESGACDFIGIGRPAAVLPRLPKEILLNPSVADEDAEFFLKGVDLPWVMSKIPIKGLGAGAESMYYGKQIQRMGKGLAPVDSRI